ncbi:type VII secretion target [Actinomycetes bacterium KLBMP 9797]
MTQPTPREVSVATDALRTEAAQWDDQSLAIAAVATKVGGLALNRIEAGLFQLLVGPYNELVTAVRSRCQEGQAAMTEIATTLRSAADTYQREDENNAHRIHHLY